MRKLTKKHREELRKIEHDLRRARVAMQRLHAEAFQNYIHYTRAESPNMNAIDYWSIIEEETADIKSALRNAIDGSVSVNSLLS
jgi:hypothetical protein